MSNRIHRRPAFWALLVVLVGVGVAGYQYWQQRSQRSASLDPRPVGTAEDIAALSQRDDVNVLFVLFDTLRADHLHSYGYERETSPVMDAIAATGVRFARQLSQSSWTKCSMASLWTGLRPARSGVTRFEHVLPQAARLPAEIFRDAGFRTAGIFRNGWVEGYFGFDQGFEIYMRPQPGPVPPDLRRENPTIERVSTDMDAVNAAVEFLRVHGDERWFLYLHFMDIHEYIYDADTAVFGTAHSDIYDNAILRVNLVLEKLMRHLWEQGHFNDTLVVLASDHGEAFGERGYEGHARNVYPEVTEVPFILFFPFQLQPGVVVGERTSNIDIWPTLLDLLGLPPMEGTDGQSRLPEILAAARGEAAPAHDGEVAIAHLDQTWGQRVKAPSPTVSVEEDGFRYLMFRDAQGTIRKEQLLNPARDPAELENFLDEEPEAAERLRAVAERYLAQEPPWEGGNPTLELDEMQLNQLRALGYALP